MKNNTSTEPSRKSSARPRHHHRRQQSSDDDDDDGCHLSGIPNGDEERQQEKQKRYTKKAVVRKKKVNNNNNINRVYNKGTWCDNERLLFLKGLRQYGKGQWKNIGTVLKSRSLVQIKSHGQKIVSKMEAGEDVFAELNHAEELVERQREYRNQGLHYIPYHHHPIVQQQQTGSEFAAIVPKVDLSSSSLSSLIPSVTTSSNSTLLPTCMSNQFSPTLYNVQKADEVVSSSFTRADEVVSSSVGDILNKDTYQYQQKSQEDDLIHERVYSDDDLLAVLGLCELSTLRIFPSRIV